jgi:hypothetical protein
MQLGRTVFSQVMDFLPMHEFRKCVACYQGNRSVKMFSCFDQYLCMAFAQLTYRESLRDIEACLRAMKPKLYHAGFRGRISRSTLADANEKRDWRIYADFAQALIQIARPLYADEDLGLDLNNTVYALDASTIDLCLSVFPWAHFRKTKAAVKLHTLLDLQGNIPTFIYISDGKLHDVNVLDILLPEPGAFYIMDRGYLDFARLYTLACANAFFVIRAKSNTRFRRRYSHEVDRSTGVICDQTIMLTGVKSAADYPQPLRRVKYRDEDIQKTFNFLTNNFNLTSLTIADLYKNRWQVEVSFQMDQAAPTHQVVFRHICQRCEDPNLDRGIRLRSRRDSQEEAENRRQPLHNSTDFERHSFRANAHFTGLSANRRHTKRRPPG